MRERDGFVYVWDGAMAEASDNVLPNFQTLSVGETGAGTALYAMSHEAFVGTLLDAPGLILGFDGLFILPELLGETQVVSGGVQAEYALSTYLPAHRTQSPPDFPFLLRIRALAGTGQSGVSVWTLEEVCVFTAVIAAEPATPWVTALRWRYADSLPKAGVEPLFKVRSAIDPARLLALRATPGSDQWKALSS